MHWDYGDVGIAHKEGNFKESPSAGRKTNDEEDADLCPEGGAEPADNELHNKEGVKAIDLAHSGKEGKNWGGPRKAWGIRVPDGEDDDSAAVLTKCSIWC